MNTITFEKKSTQVVAHRGLSGIETENTNAAFVAAGNRSYYGIETDIHRTADGRFVVCHDDDLKRVAGEAILVESSNLSELQNVVLFDKFKAGINCGVCPTATRVRLKIKVHNLGFFSVADVCADFLLDNAFHLFPFLFMPRLSCFFLPAAQQQPGGRDAEDIE